MITVNSCRFCKPVRDKKKKKYDKKQQCASNINIIYRHENKCHLSKTWQVDMKPSGNDHNTRIGMITKKHFLRLKHLRLITTVCHQWGHHYF